MATKTLEQLTAEATELGIKLTGDEKAKDIAEAIKMKKEEMEKENAKNKKAKTVIFYHVKTRAYKNDTERVEIGLYRTNKAVERFDRMPDEYVEKFEDEVPVLELHKIAEKYRVNVYADGGKKARSEDEILEEIVKEL